MDVSSAPVNKVAVEGVPGYDEYGREVGPVRGIADAHPGSPRRVWINPFRTWERPVTH